MGTDAEVERHEGQETERAMAEAAQLAREETEALQCEEQQKEKILGLLNASVEEQTTERRTD